jgi:hypothetical protein
MATYLSAEMNGSGSVGEQLNGVKTFIITNNLNNLDNYEVGYLTLEGNATANQNLSTTTYLTGSFSSFSGGVDEENLVYTDESTHWSISISGGVGQFQFTPTSLIAQGSYYIKSTGLFDLAIV